MNDEMIKTYEDNDNTEVSVEIYEEPIEQTGNGIVGKIVVGILTAAAAGGVAWYATRKKREERQIKKLEKKGYVICKPVEVVDAEVVSNDDPETEG